MTRPAEKPKHLLAFGDSLTFGYRRYKSRAPYTDRLQKSLAEHGEWKITNAGVSGQRTEVMVPRLERILKENPNTFTHIVILAGTNNLWNTDKEKIAEDLRRLCDMAINYGARTYVLTIPDLGHEADAELGHIRASRVWVNEQIMRRFIHARIVPIDLASKLPLFKMLRKDRLKYWDLDVLHFTAMGYAKMADVIYEAMRPDLVGIIGRAKL